MIDLANYKKKFILEQFIIGVEEPILIKPVGEFVAKIDSGNSGYNVIHGENMQRQGKMLFFTTHDKNGMVKNVSKPIHDEVTINMGGGYVETRPVILLDVKFADTDYKKIPFSVSDRTQQTNKVLICKDFVCNQLKALIDPSAKEISGKNIQAEVVKEGLKSRIDDFNRFTKQFTAGEGGALTSYLSGFDKDGKPYKKDKDKNEKEDQVKRREKETPQEVSNQQPAQQTSEYQNKEEEEPNQENTSSDLNEDQYQQFLDVIKDKTGIERKDAERARITAGRKNLLDNLGFSKSDVYKDTAYWPLLNYLGYALGNLSNSHQGRLRKTLQQTLKRERKLNSSFSVEDSDLECIFEANEEYFDDGSTPTQDAAEQIPQQATQTEEQPQSTDIVKAFFDRNYFSFGFLQMSQSGQLYDEMRAFQKIQKTRGNYFVALGEKFFNNITNRTFMPNDPYAIDFVKGCVKELQKKGITGAICVNIGAPPNRITRFYTGDGLVLESSNTDQTKIERTLLDLYNSIRHRWVNDSVLKNYKLSLDFDRNYYEDLANNRKVFKGSSKLPIRGMLRIYDIIDNKTDSDGNILSSDDPKLEYIKKATDAAFEKVKRQMAPYTPQTGEYRVRPVKEEISSQLKGTELEWIHNHAKQIIKNFQNSLSNNDANKAIQNLETLKARIEDKVNFVLSEKITKKFDPVIDLLKKYGNDPDTVKALKKADIFKLKSRK